MEKEIINDESRKEIKLVLTREILERYSKLFKKNHPRVKRMPIDKPYHPSINQWCILPRIQMNYLKQRWKDFTVWWIHDLGLNDLYLDDFDLVQTVYFQTRHRHDVDNQVPKFFLDGLTASGFIVDDDESRLHSLTIKTGYDKENPRTEFLFIIHENKENKKDDNEDGNK